MFRSRRANTPGESPLSDAFLSPHLLFEHLPDSRRPRPRYRELTRDKRSLVVNDSLILAGIPAEVFEYRLGNRSAIEWVIDQYRVKEDKRSGVRSDPNNPDDPEYIVRLVGQVVRVSVETVKIVAALPEHYAPQPKPPPSAG